MSSYTTAADLFGNYRIIKGDRVLDERATLIKYFVDEIKRPPQFIGVRLSHYTLDQLYALQSSYKDRLNRNNRETADKWWWFTTKTQAVEN